MRACRVAPPAAPASPIRAGSAMSDFPRGAKSAKRRDGQEAHCLVPSPSRPRIVTFAVRTGRGQAGETSPVATATFCCPFTV
jgi:hypothetical protein